MNIEGLSMNLAVGKVQSQVGMKVLSKALDTEEQMGQGIVNMIDAAAMERSVNPAVGGNFDVKL